MVLNLRNGNDLVFIPKFKKSLEIPGFIQRIFNDIEIKYCEGKVDKASSFAARFAAKEAFSKALGTGLYAEGVTPLDLWIENEESGRPKVLVSEKLKNKLSCLRMTHWDITLSHHNDYAIAHVIIWGPEY